MNAKLPEFLQRLIDNPPWGNGHGCYERDAYAEGIHDAYRAMMDENESLTKMMIDLVTASGQTSKQYFETLDHFINRARNADEKIRALELKVKGIKQLVNEQAEDEGLWFIARHATEDYVQRALRKLHEQIEKEDTHE